MSCGAMACAVDVIPVAESTTVAETQSESEGPATDLPMVDLPLEPECPAGLGEVVACECAVVEGCTIPNAEPETGCNFACEVPTPCGIVICTFDSSLSWPTCETLVDVAALQCVFDALAEGQPFRWFTNLYDTYGFAWDDALHQFQRLDATTYIAYRDYRFGNGVDPGWTEQTFAGLEIQDSDWMACEAVASEHERFNCLHALAEQGQPCADPSVLLCPAAP
jgi:hypothetical protein